MKNHQRKSNYELMRIISMYMIIINHILDRQLTINTTGTTQLIIYVINVIIRVHVCSFVLLSGYFQYKNRFKLSKVISINNSVWFYNVVYFVVLSLFGLVSLGSVDKFKVLSPLCYNNYWFVITYLLLYLISPLLNIIINKVNKKQFQKIIILLFCLFSIMTSCTGNNVYNNNSGFSVTNFILLYFIGSYLGKYPIKDCFIFKKMSNNLFKLVCIVSFMILAGINLLILYFTNSVASYGNIIGYISGIFKSMVFSYDNPIIIIQSVFYFLFFGSLSFKNKFINKIAKYTLGIYLVHENPLITPFIYKWLGFTKLFYDFRIIPKIFICALIVFVVSLLIEMIRSFIFKFIYNRKASCKFRNWYRGYIKSLGLNINW